MGIGYNILTESGIQIDGGELISEGKVVELVRKAKELFEAEKYEEFMALTCDGIADRLSDDEMDIMCETAITEDGKTIYRIANDIEDGDYGLLD